MFKSRQTTKNALPEPKSGGLNVSEERCIRHAGRTVGYFCRFTEAFAIDTFIFDILFAL